MNSISPTCAETLLTIGSNHSLRSLGRAKARPLTKRYTLWTDMERIHRSLFFIILILSLIWGFITLNDNLPLSLRDYGVMKGLKDIYILTFTVPFWPMFYLEVLDYIKSRTGSNGKLYNQYAKGIQKDLVVTTVTALTLASIYWLDRAPYSFSSIDLGFIGFPFMIYSIYTIFQMRQVKIAGSIVNRTPLMVMLGFVSIFTILSYAALIKNSSGEFETYQAIWIQITILFASFFIFMNTSLQLHFLTQGKFKLSEFKSHFLSNVVRSKHGIYEGMREPISQLNKRLAQKKAEHSSRLRKKK